MPGDKEEQCRHPYDTAGHIGLTAIGVPVEQPVVDGIEIKNLKWAAAQADSASNTQSTVDAASASGNEQDSQADSAEQAEGIHAGAAESGTLTSPHL